MYCIRGHHRSTLIAEAMLAGVRAYGDRAALRYEDEFDGVADCDAAVFYGLEGRMPDVFAAYKAIGRAVYCDLGYWGRRAGGRWTGYHKVAVNARHPTAYFRKPARPRDRAAALGVQVQPFRKDGRHILLAGMGDKGATAEGYKPEAWERWAIGEIRRFTDRPILYRAKPSWKAARPIAGVEWSPKDREVADELRDCWAVVTHHSNVAVEALVAGVPAFCWGGVAEPLSLSDLSSIEEPWHPGDREQWVADIAYTQWSVDEMRRGLAWAFLRKEGLV